MAECIDAVPLFFRQSEGLADFLDAAVHVGAEAVCRGVARVEVEEVRTIVISLILLDDWQYHRLDAHLEIGFVFAAVACLGSLVAETATLIVLFL